MEKSIRVLVIDDHYVVRKGYAFIFQSLDSVSLVAEAGTIQEAIEVYAKEDVDVILMDMRLPDISGVEMIEALIDLDADVRIVATTAFDDEIHYVRQALEAGAKGFVYKNTPIDTLQLAIQKVYEGETFLDRLATANLIESTNRPTRKHYQLTDREMQVLTLISLGLTNREISHQLALSESTIKIHVRNIITKLNASNRIQAVIIAYKSGLLES